MKLEKIFNLRRYTSKRKSVLMQFIEKRSGKLFNYYPDSAPNTYSDCADIKAVFRVTHKYKTRWFNITLFGKDFEIKVVSNW